MAWDSGGDIVGGRFVYQIDEGDMRVSGKIAGGSTVVLVSIHGSITVDDRVDEESNVSLTADSAISIGGKIDDKSIVGLVCNNGPVTIDGKMDDHSSLSVTSAGDISLGVGAGLGGGDRKIDGSSTAVLVSHHGSITIGGKVDQNSHVWLAAQGDVGIGALASGEDAKIDGNSHVDATSGGVISLGYWIGGGQGGHTSVDFKACDGIAIGNDIKGGSTVRLLTGTGSISVGGEIHDGTTSVTFWPPGSLQVAGGTHDGAAVNAAEWAALEPLCKELPPVVGHWWQNWPMTFGYVCQHRSFPRSLAEMSQAILSANIDQNVKAVGGGWSFSDAALPFRTQGEVNRVSTLLRGASGMQDVSRLLQTINDVTSTPMDLLPEAVTSAVAFSTHYDQPSTTQRTSTGALLPGSAGNVQIIDTRSLASSLQCDLGGILSGPAKRRREGGQLLFHVEAGITMADLDQLLDHQSPRMAIQASGGSPGATLAGTLSTATHGGEFRWPLLVDMVRAIHLVGPAGEEWWIEGEESIANPVALHNRYPNLDAAHFIGGAWNGIPGLTAQDVLNAVIVSMGTMGVIYSVVLEVVPQFGLQQIVTSTSWSSLLGMASTTEALLRQGNVQANEAVLKVILDGSVNGTGIAEADNVYADLAINPFNYDCWITNRRRTPVLPVDGNSPAATVGDYMSSLNEPLSGNAKDTVQHSHLIGRVFDFLGWATDIPSVNISDDINDFSQASALLGFLTRFPDLFTAALATINVQTVANTMNAAGHPDRGQLFLGDVLTGFFRALQGSEPGRNSDRTDIAYKVGAIGWPDGGLPGRGLEVALDPRRAFTFLQTILFDDVLQNTMAAGNNPLIGYISIRICPRTKTLMGMQQYSPYSVMTEVVGYRSPEANAVMDLIQEKVLDQNKNHGLNAMLHWGLENQMMTAADLTHTPLQQLIRPTSTFTRLDAFRAVRKFLQNGKPPVFDNNFVYRLHL